MEKYLAQIRDLKKTSDDLLDKGDYELSAKLYGAAVVIENLSALLDATREALLERISE